MKSFPLFLLLALATPSYAQDQAANPDVVELLPSQKAFLNLSEDKRKEFMEHLSEATRYFQQKRIFESLESLEEAEKVFEDSSEILNLRGSNFVEMRAFQKAEAAFKKALEINPTNTSIRFNLAETKFVTRNWQEAHDLFTDLLKDIPAEQIPLSRLIEYKIFLCNIKLDKEAEVIAQAEKYGYLDDSPYYYYAKAALSYQDDDLLEAEEWLARANRIFRDPAIIAPWQDTLVEFGYIKSFYGGEVIDE